MAARRRRYSNDASARLTRWPGLIEHYRRFLPVTSKTPVVTLNEGNTPLIESIRAGEIVSGQT